MHEPAIGSAFLFGLGLIFESYGLSQLLQAYRVEPLDEWMTKALPGAGSIVLGVLFAWSGYWLERHSVIWAKVAVPEIRDIARN